MTLTPVSGPPGVTLCLFVRPSLIPARNASYTAQRPVRGKSAQQDRREERQRASHDERRGGPVPLPEESGEHARGEGGHTDRGPAQRAPTTWRVMSSRWNSASPKRGSSALARFM